uniref:Uncharacterized protein n=1 Tax=viral metagenome TaxID=1070528 RepID=A0A6M3IRS7_9ZZZZ
MTTDCIELLGALTNSGIPLKQDALAFSLWGPLGSVRRVQAACQEARLAGWPLVTSGTGVRLENTPAAVAECAAALRRRAITQLLTARALRRTAERMREPMTLWEKTYDDLFGTRDSLGRPRQTLSAAASSTFREVNHGSPALAAGGGTGDCRQGRTNAGPHRRIEVDAMMTDDDGLNGCRGIIAGCLLSAPIWLLIGFVIRRFL